MFVYIYMYNSIYIAAQTILILQKVRFNCRDLKEMARVAKS